MNTDEMKHRFNLVGAIAAIGALIALIGVVVAYGESPKVSIIDVLIYALIFAVSLGNIKPNLNFKTALGNVAMGILGIAIATFMYFDIANAAEAQSFTDVGYGIWIVFIGIFLFTMFCISDAMYKKNQ